MSPEYAMTGHFSEKSDVFSFGVLLLEIISGRRNSNSNHQDHSLTLVGYVSSKQHLPPMHLLPMHAITSNVVFCHFQAWKLWKEGKIEAFIDSTIYNPCFHWSILRCIHVGLLCVQESVKDRPTMSTVISMLNSEIADLPSPKQLGFAERTSLDSESPELGKVLNSVNDVSITVIQGR